MIPIMALVRDLSRPRRPGPTRASMLRAAWPLSAAWTVTAARTGEEISEAGQRGPPGIRGQDVGVEGDNVVTAMKSSLIPDDMTLSLLGEDSDMARIRLGRKTTTSGADVRLGVDPKTTPLEAGRDGCAEVVVATYRWGGAGPRRPCGRASRAARGPACQDFDPYAGPHRICDGPHRICAGDRPAMPRMAFIRAPAHPCFEGAGAVPFMGCARPVAARRPPLPAAIRPQRTAAADQAVTGYRRAWPSSVGSKMKCAARCRAVKKAERCDARAAPPREDSGESG
jgi:hypothetical protein